MITIIHVNLQEGLILDGKHLIGSYSHHSKAIVFTASEDYVKTRTLPDAVKDYTQIYIPSSFSIRCWTNEGDKKIPDIAYMHELKVSYYRRKQQSIK